MKKSNFAPAVFALGSVLVSSIASADQAACLSAKGNAGWRISRINTMFADGGKCASLSAESQAAVSAEPSSASLENFRRIKAAWLVDFDGSNPYAIKYSLDEIRTKTNDLLHAPAGSPPISAGTRAKAQALITKIDNLYRAAERMRPNGATTPGNVTAVDNAFDSLDGACPNDHTGAHCPGFGPGAVTSLFDSIQSESTHESNPLLSSLHEKLGQLNLSESRAEFDNIHAILDCRLSNDALPGLRVQAAASCPADPAAVASVNATPNAGDPVLAGLNLQLFRWDYPALPTVAHAPFWLINPAVVNGNAAPQPAAPVAQPQSPAPVAASANDMDAGAPPANGSGDGGAGPVAGVNGGM